jgi:hypothetical protein
MPTILLHIQNEDPVLGEVDELPKLTDTIIIIKNPRKRDGKDLAFIDSNISTVIWPINRMNFIEVIPSEEEEEIITFVRE